MRTVGRAWLLAVVAVAAACGSAWYASTRSATALSARERAIVLAVNLAQIGTLSSQQETALLASRPTDSLSTSVRGVLAKLGLPESTLKSLKSSEEGTATLMDFAGSPPSNQPSYRRQAVTLDLSPLSPAQAGQFIAAWQASEPAWLLTRLELTHTGSESETRYSARLVLATTYVASNAQTSKSSITTKTPH